MIDRYTERRNRKRRQWGLHGHDRYGWILRSGLRTAFQHHYQKWWVTNSPGTARKWMALSWDFHLRTITDRIERRKRVAEKVEAQMLIEYGGQP